MPSLFKEIFQQVFRRFVKDRGRFPTPAERDALQDVALKESRKQAEMIDPVFKGMDKMDPDKPFRGFKPKVVPKEGELSVTIEGKTKNMTPEGIMDFLMRKGKSKDTNIGKAPKTKTKDFKQEIRDLVEADEAARTRAEDFKSFSNRIKSMSLEQRAAERAKDLGISLEDALTIERMKKQNKEAAARLRKKKQDREDFSGGGRIGFSGGGAGLPAVSGGAMVFDDTPVDGFGPGRVGPDFFVMPEVDPTMLGIMPGFQKNPDPGMLMDPRFIRSSPTTDIMSMEEGGPVDPDRRTFVKILGGLASIPILSKFVTPFKQAAPVVAETAKEVPAYFFKLVDKIRRLGDDAPGLTTIERESGKKYKNYEMVEDQTTGDIVIKKQKEGGAMYGDEFETGIVQEEVLAYRTPKNTPEGRLSADYEEVTVRPDVEGKMKDIEDGLDSMDEILEEVGEAQLKKAGGGLAYMLGE